MMTNGISYTAEALSDDRFSIETPSYRGLALQLTGDSIAWEVTERDTHRKVADGTATRRADALDQMTRAIADDM